MDKNIQGNDTKNNNLENKKPVQNQNNGKMSTGSKVAVGVFGGCAVIFLGFIIIVVLLIFLGFSSVGTVDFENIDNGTNISESVQEEYENQLGGVGDRLLVGNLEYMLIGYGIQDSIGEGFSKEEAKEGSKLVVVELWVKNIGEEEEFLSPSNLNLIDKDNIQYESSFHFGEDSLSLNALEPNASQEGTVIFEVPELTATEYLNLNISKTSWVEEEINQFAIDLRQ